jgi:beta-galactosidase
VRQNENRREQTMGAFLSVLQRAKIRLVNHRVVVRSLTVLLEYIITRFCTPNSYIFGYFEKKYVKEVNSLIEERNIKTKAAAKGDNVADWENSLVVGRNRRHAHVRLHGFQSPEAAIKHWTTASDKSSTRLSNPNIVYLSTSIYHEPDQNSRWKFMLVGSPDNVPSGWFEHKPDTADDAVTIIWSTIQVPGHWQLQGYDIPIYTNTMYPFELNPPYARRTGKWTVTDCDAGLHGSSVSETNTVHPNEPGPNPTGLYRKSFTLPGTWTASQTADSSPVGKPSRVFLVFEGVDSCLSVWVDGIYVGYSQDSCLPAEFDITDVLSQGDPTDKHTLAVQVSRWCDGSYLEDQDKWWLSGIYRPVYLLRKSATHIADYEITTDVSLPSDPDREKTIEEEIDEKILGPADPNDFVITATVNVNLLVESYEQSSDTPRPPFGVRVEVFKANAPDQPVSVACSACETLMYRRSAFPLRVMAETIMNTETADFSATTGGRLACNGGLAHINLNKPDLWTAESPNLYLVVISLFPTLADAENNNKAVLLDVESTRLGIRDVKLGTKNNVLCVNGAPITIAGVNRHEFDPKQGRFVTDAVMKQDIRLLKQFNFNAVRCSHYPHHDRFLELCDEAGMISK